MEGRNPLSSRRLDEGTQPFDVGDDGLARGFKNMALLLEAGDGATNGFRRRSTISARTGSDLLDEAAPAFNRLLHLKNISRERSVS